MATPKPIENGGEKSASDCTHMLACPFCGSGNLRVCDHGIECRNCGVWMNDGTQCRTIIGKMFLDALDAWNHRANIEIIPLR